MNIKFRRKVSSEKRKIGSMQSVQKKNIVSDFDDIHMSSPLFITYILLQRTTNSRNKKEALRPLNRLQKTSDPYLFLPIPTVCRRCFLIDASV